MKAVFFVLRFLGFLVFLLLAIGYYHEGMITNGVLAAVVGGLCVSPAEKYPYGVRTKSALIIAGLLVIVLLAPT